MRGIYQILNTVNNKRYIGSAKDVEVRWSVHRSEMKLGKHHSILLQRAWSKYGESSFKFEIIEIIDDDLLLVPTEQSWMDKYDSANPKFGYNVCPVAGNCLGIKVSQQTRTKMSNARKGRHFRPMAAETRLKISLAKKGRTPIHRVGVKHTQETRQKISDKLRGNRNQAGRVVSEATRQKIRSSLIGHPRYLKRV